MRLRPPHQPTGIRNSQKATATIHPTGDGHGHDLVDDRPAIHRMGRQRDIPSRAITLHRHPTVLSHEAALSLSLSLALAPDMVPNLVLAPDMVPNPVLVLATAPSPVLARVAGTSLSHIKSKATSMEDRLIAASHQATALSLVLVPAAATNHPAGTTRIIPRATSRGHLTTNLTALSHALSHVLARGRATAMNRRRVINHTSWTTTRAMVCRASLIRSIEIMEA